MSRLLVIVLLILVMWQKLWVGLVSICVMLWCRALWLRCPLLALLVTVVPKVISVLRLVLAVGWMVTSIVCCRLS